MGIRTNPILNVICRPVIWIAQFVGRNYPETLVKVRYWARFKRRLNLNNPQTLNEKILYMSLRTDTTLWTRLADKYAVREYVEECGLADILVPLYGHWENAHEINFNQLPNSYVLKTVQGSGDIIVVKDKNIVDTERIRQQIEKSSKVKYGELEGGKHYMRIKSAIIAEELLINDEDSTKYSNSIIDYKVWCFNGNPYYIMTCTNRKGNGVELQMYDTDWIPHETYIKQSTHYKSGAIIPTPPKLDKVLEYSKILSKQFPVVRVDFYNIGGKIYFGEMTFTSLGGLMDYYTDEFQEMCGNLIDINYKG